MSAAILDLITGRPRDLGGFSVARVLPIGHRKTVGPFIFFDHFGPTVLAAGRGMDVRPHPHIGLATVTYLFEGRIRHRDSLGTVQDIEPGAVNWMSAGRGIVHSERSTPEDRLAPLPMHGIQSWVALPQDQAECAPAFVHHPAATLPQWQLDGATLRLIAGCAYGRESPVDVASPLFYVHGEWTYAGRLPLPEEHAERAVYVVQGAVTIAGARIPAGTLAVLGETATALDAEADTVAMLLGGSPMDGPREVWWNFVSADSARIEQAKADWAAGRFGNVPGETEFIPLPAS